jgi:hypothetical protein
MGFVVGIHRPWSCAMRTKSCLDVEKFPASQAAAVTLNHCTTTVRIGKKGLSSDDFCTLSVSESGTNSYIL